MQEPEKTNERSSERKKIKGQRFGNRKNRAWKNRKNNNASREKEWLLKCREHNLFLSGLRHHPKIKSVYYVTIYIIHL